MDLLEDNGFALAIRLVLSLSQGALLWVALPCSSWIWINRGTSGRNRLLWAGNTTLKYIHDANKMVSRTVLLLWIASWRGVTWVLEQPISSVMGEHDRLQQLFQGMVVYRTRASQGAFGGETKKVLKFWGNHPWIGELSTYKAMGAFAKRASRTRVNRRGIEVTDGNHKALRESQTYSRKFGRVVASLFLTHRDAIVAEQARGFERATM